jgi:hypothetical protein
MINFPLPNCRLAVINSISVLFSERNIRHDELPTSLAILLLEIVENEDLFHVLYPQYNRVI